MFPIGDDNPTKRTPYVTYGLIAINLAIFLYEVVLQNQVLGTVPYVEPGTGRRAINSLTGEVVQRAITGLDYFFDQWAVVPAQLTASLTGQPIQSQLPNLGGQPPESLTLISSQFLHGGWSHLLGNMLFLWIFGNNVEDKLGRVKFLGFYLGCGILAGLTQWWFSQGSYVPSLGASGAIAGVMGAYIIRFPKVPIKTLFPPFFVFDVPALMYLGIWFVQQAFYSFASLPTTSNVGMQSGGIAYWAHAGGFVFGAILGPLLGLFKDVHDPAIDTERNAY
ncbi:rhomboid family intramembrane serine protease [filamentous cyanobacterium LEGE 11480]|uniref:Rhomboid family intramembrane serine protease n=1 Tax=Romeriopsis navalis LEGE 11480 TaxID=2777977 RepID=A0A928Z5I1_9CYAN|nr:rhomboid family intramembrane serine protease [Romeriopsis navalis]MBE9031295.1 rhomboid family intramembrane serine protease [Romeriopsis navalis LEGE 11480]